MNKSQRKIAARHLRNMEQVCIDTINYLSEKAHEFHVNADKVSSGSGSLKNWIRYFEKYQGHVSFGLDDDAYEALVDLGQKGEDDW